MRVFSCVFYSLICPTLCLIFLPQIQRKTHKQRIVNLVRVSRDVEPSDVMTAEFLVKGDALRIVLLDRWGNVVVCGSDSTADNNSGGRVLFRESAFYLGRRVVASMRLQCAGGNSNWHFVKYLSLEGSQGHIVPIDEVAYRRLEMLQAKLHVVLPHLAGLNPKGERCGCEGWEWRWELFNPRNRPFCFAAEPTASANGSRGKLYPRRWMAICWTSTQC